MRRVASAVACLVAATPAASDPAPPVRPSTLAFEVADAFTIPLATRRVNAVETAPDGSGRRFVVTLEGLLYVEDAGAVSVYLDLAGAVGPDLKTSPGLSSGFIALAFHPNFAINGRFFTVHTERGDATGPDHAPVQDPPSILEEGVGPVATTYQHSVLTEWTAADPGASVFTGASREVMRLGALGHLHPMGDLIFDPAPPPGDPADALLYIAVGDGMSQWLGYAGNDAEKPNNLQRLDALLGTILRIDPAGADGVDGRYGSPPSNPFVGVAGARAEIYALGFRNPHRLAFDAHTGHLYAADIGENTIEEVNRVVPGANYGWAEREGPFLVGGGALDPDIATGAAADAYTYPVAIYDHDEGDAIAGVLPMRRGPLASRALLGDITTGRLFVSDLGAIDAADDGAPITTAPVFEIAILDAGVERTLLGILNDTAATSRADLRLAAGAGGAVYLLNKHDGVVRTLAQRACPADLDRNGAVDGADLGTLLGAWGADPDPGADLNADGVVDGADLGALVGAWGPCPSP